MPTPLQPGDVVRIRGERWTIARHAAYADCAIVEAHRHDSVHGGERASFIVPAEAIERLPSIDTPRVVRSTRWRRLACRALGSAHPTPAALRTAARAAFDVLPFQLEPALAVTTGTACRLLLADEVGLGKTIQAGLVVSEILERARDGHALIVTPAGLRDQWRLELERWLRLDATVIDSAALARMSSGVAEPNPWCARPLVVASIDFVKRPEVLRSLESLVWDAVVFDEAHALAGRSDRTNAATALATRARHVLLLTATPHAGDERAFDRLCGIGDLGNGFPCLLFRRTRATAGLPASRRTTWLRVRPTADERRVHRALMEYARTVWAQSESSAARLAMSVLARRAASSATSLVKSLERRLALLSDTVDPASQLMLPFSESPDDEIADGILGAPGLDDLPHECDWLRRLLTLARAAATNESKVRALRQFLRRTQTPALVFTEYRDTLEHVSAALGQPAEHLHGRLTATERQHATTRFTVGDSIVMLATDAASEGLNLQHRCHLVVNLELPWSPIRLEQRIGRVDRIGQPARVHAVNLVAAGTIEERIIERLLRRAERARTALETVQRMTDLDIARQALGARAADPVKDRHTVASSHSAASAPPAHLQRMAIAEAARIRTARALLQAASGDASFERPVVADLSKRRLRRRCCWALRVRFVDNTRNVRWETLFGLDATTTPALSIAAGDLRDVLSTSNTIEEAIAHAVDGLTATVRDTLAPYTGLSIAREQSLERAIARHSARLAAVVAQGSLFDRRHERAAAAQQAIAEEAARRCKDRLRELDAMRTLSPCRRELVFAIVLDHAWTPFADA